MIKFHKQETRYSCAPACLRMVLSALGVDIDEAKLRELVDCTRFGTEAFQLVQAARKLGFGSTRKHTLGSLDELLQLLDEGHFPIVYVDLWPLTGGVCGQYHSFVITAVGRESLSVLDPLIGERIIPRDEFEAAWGETRWLTIVVSA